MTGEISAGRVMQERGDSRYGRKLSSTPLAGEIDGLEGNAVQKNYWSFLIDMTYGITTSTRTRIAMNWKKMKRMSAWDCE